MRMRNKIPATVAMTAADKRTLSFCSNKTWKVSHFVSLFEFETFILRTMATTLLTVLFVIGGVLNPLVMFRSEVCYDVLCVSKLESLITPIPLIVLYSLYYGRSTNFFSPVTEPISYGDTLDVDYIRFSYPSSLLATVHTKGAYFNESIEEFGGADVRKVLS